MHYHFKNDKIIGRKLPSFHGNVPGPFYTQDHCIVCGGPGQVAPELIAFSDELGITPKGDAKTVSCMIYRQPESWMEIIKMVDAMDSSCVECLRYSGSNEDVLSLIRSRNMERLCDISLP